MTQLVGSLCGLAVPAAAFVLVDDVPKKLPLPLPSFRFVCVCHQASLHSTRQLDADAPPSDSDGLCARGLVGSAQDAPGAPCPWR